MQQKAAASTRVKLSEIFTSIEGEGILFGTKTMFVRMAGCPLKCHWCDTPYALPLDSGSDYSIDSAKELISKNLHVNTSLNLQDLSKERALGRTWSRLATMPRGLPRSWPTLTSSR